VPEKTLDFHGNNLVGLVLVMLQND